MTVAELIDRLNTLPSDFEVFFSDVPEIGEGYSYKIDRVIEYTFLEKDTPPDSRVYLV